MAIPPSTETHAESRRVKVLEHHHQPVAAPPAKPTRLGALLAVCGVAGGVGVSTLAYLIALAAAQQRSGPVLVADTGAPGGGLAVCAGIESSVSLRGLCQTAVRPARFSDFCAAGPARLRVLATGPEFKSSVGKDRLPGLLRHARETHELTVIDCGTLAGEIDQLAMAVAPHQAWIIPATDQGVDRARTVLEAAPRVAGKELIVGRGTHRQPKGPVRDLRRLADERRASLVLLPHLPHLESGHPDGALDGAQLPLQAILGALAR